MITTSIARPYAKAAFEFAKSANELPLWSVALRSLAIATENVAMVSLLANPLVSSKRAAELLLSVLQKTISNITAESMQAIENFVRLLAEYKRLNILSDISRFFEADVAGDAGYLQLTVTSAYSLDDNQQDKVVARLKAQLQSEVKVMYTEDPEIIGGIIVRSENWVLDDSVRGRLAKLQSALQ